MSAFGGDSPLSEAPSSNSPARSIGSPTKSPSPPKKSISISIKKPIVSSASSSRRSSRIESRSQSPEKPSGQGPNNLKFKVTRPVSPEKTALGEIPEETQVQAEQEKEKEKGKRGKKRKSEPLAESELREAIGKGKKKAKVSHDTSPTDDQKETEDEPKKRNVAIKKKSNGGAVQTKSSADLIADLFGDDDDDEDEDEVVAEQPKVVKPVIKIKGKPGRKPKVDKDGDVEMNGKGEDQVEKETHIKQSKSPSTTSRPEEGEGNEPNDEIVAEAPINSAVSNAKSTSKAKKAKPKPTEDSQAALPEETKTDLKTSEVPTNTAKPRGRPKKTHIESRSTIPTVEDPEQDKLVLETKTDKEEIKEPVSTTTTNTVKPKKSFAQVVAASPPPDPKKERKPIPTIQKLTKSVPGSGTTPDKRVTSTGSISGTGTNTPAKKLVPVQKKKEVSLLESTMASLLGGGAKPTPKKDEKDTPKSTPKATVKDRQKGQWQDTWVLTPVQQREVLESKEEREREREKRKLYRRNPVNLQEAKDAYRLDSTKTRVIPALPFPHGGLGVKTDGAPSMMLKALIERNQSQSV